MWAAVHEVDREESGREWATAVLLSEVPAVWRNAEGGRIQSCAARWPSTTTMTTDWFSALTGFPERSWTETQANLSVAGNELRSLANHRTYATGTLETPSLADLRTRAADVVARHTGTLSVSTIVADVTHLHCNSAHRHALFQVASQFNLLEATGPDVTPEDGVTRYAHDRTQGRRAR